MCVCVCVYVHQATQKHTHTQLVISKTKKANEGDLFCDDILSFIGGESSVEDNEDGYTP